VFRLPNLSEAAQHHSVINRLKKFSEIRNKLIHGYSISSVITHDGHLQQTRTRQQLTKDFMLQQIDLYQVIIDNLGFFVNALGNINSKQKEDFINRYLDASFLTETHI
jgi:hypothetical protein